MRLSARALRCTTRAAASPTSWLPPAARHAPAPRARARAGGRCGAVALAAGGAWSGAGDGTLGRGAAGEGTTGPLQV